MKTLTPNNEFGIPKKELMTIANMVEHTPITKRKYFGVFKKLLPKYDTHQDDLIIKKSLEQYYTCKNFDKKNKICKIYEDRPRMCKGFPHENDFKLTYGSKCNYKKCTGCNNKEGDNKSYMNIKK